MAKDATLATMRRELGKEQAPSFDGNIRKKTERWMRLAIGSVLIAFDFFWWQKRSDKELEIDKAWNA